MIVRCLLSIAIALAFGPLAAEEKLQHVLLFDSGRDGYGRYRIPCLVVTPSGAVLAIAEGRKGGGGLTGDIDLVVRRSLDSGNTWSAVAVLADDGEHTLGNPCAVVDASTRRVWVAFTRSLGSDTEEQIVAGASRERTRVRLISTQDNGERWTNPVDVTDTCRRSDWTWYGTGPGVGLQLQSGRLVIPSYHAEELTRVYRSHMVYSDDHGRSWQHGSPVGEHCGECHVVQRSDGRLCLFARTNQGRERRTVAQSADGGRTWSDAEFDDRHYDPHCQACVIALPPTPARPSRWVFTHPAGPGRRNLTARLSLDEGRTWPVAKTLRHGDSQYSCLARLPNGSIGCLYDCWVDGNYRLFFVTFPESWLAAE